MVIGSLSIVGLVTAGFNSRWSICCTAATVGSILSIVGTVAKIGALVYGGIALSQICFS